MYGWSLGCVGCWLRQLSVLSIVIGMHPRLLVNNCMSVISYRPVVMRMRPVSQHFH